MGVSVIYSAVTPESTLYARLQQEKVFSILMVALFPYGNGIFRFFEIEPDEVEEILEYVIETYQDTLGSQLEADLQIAEFRDELRRTRQAYPGIENREAMLEKSFDEIRKRLLQQLRDNQGEDLTEFVDKLMFGDRTLAPHLLPKSDSLGLISVSLVREGASILETVDSETLFRRNDSQEQWYLEQFERWKGLYLAANEKNEEILVGVF